MGIVVIVVKARLAQCDSSILMADDRSGMTPVAICYGPTTRWFPTGTCLLPYYSGELKTGST